MISMGFNEYQVFYNRSQAAPLICTISPNDREWEIAVCKAYIYAPSETVYNAKETSDEDDGLPSFWMLTAGDLFIDDEGVARIIKPGWGNAAETEAT